MVESLKKSQKKGKTKVQEVNPRLIEQDDKMIVVEDQVEEMIGPEL